MESALPSFLGLGVFWDAGVIAAERRQEERGSDWCELSNLVYRARNAMKALSQRPAIFRVYTLVLEIEMELC